MSQSTAPSEQCSPTIEDKILHCLSVFPIISPSMLQVGIGTNIPPAEWKPILRRLILEGKVLEGELETLSTSGRYISYTRITVNKDFAVPVL